MGVTNTNTGDYLVDFVWYNGLWTSSSSILALTIYLLPCARHHSNGFFFSPWGTSVLVDDDQWQCNQGWRHATPVMLDSSSGPLFPCGSYHQPRCSVNTEKQYVNWKCIIDFDFQIAINNHFKTYFLTTHLNQLNVHNGVSIEIHHCITPIFCRVPCCCCFFLNIDISNHHSVLCLAFYSVHSFWLQTICNPCINYTISVKYQYLESQLSCHHQV